jgi:hypothetical protein
MGRYLVKTGRANLPFLSHLKVRNLVETEEGLMFQTDRKSLEQIKDFPDTTYHDRHKLIRDAFIRKHLTAVIGCLLMTLALINMNMGIAAVRFTDADTYDEAVLAHMEKYYRKVGPFRYLNASLSEINHDLRSTFYQYEWIGVRKNGAVLYLDIKKLENPPVEHESTPGAMYAKTEGIVKEYHVVKGTVVIQEEQYVAAGDLLISGAVQHYNNEVELVRATGYVLAEVLRYHDFTIAKQCADVVRTGRLEIVKAYVLFGRQINKTPSAFENYVVEEGRTIGGRVFQIKTFYRYELKDVTTRYDADDAVNYAKSLVYKEFRAEKTIPKERIDFIRLVRLTEDDDYYYVRLIVKSYQNIAHFVPYQ